MPAAVSVFDRVTGDELAVALDGALSALGWSHRPGPTDRYEIGLAQGEGEGLLWWEDGGAVVLERHPGVDARFGFRLTQAISAATDGLAVAVDALGGRTRYGLLAAYAGRTVELAVCDGDGVLESGRPAREGPALCDEEVVWARFTEWSRALAPRLRDADGPPLGAWLAQPATLGPAAGPEPAAVAAAPLARAWFASVSPDAFAAALDGVGDGWRWTAGDPIVLEREGALDRALVRRLAIQLDAEAFAVGLGAEAGPFTWLRHGPGGTSDGAGLGAGELIARFTAWRATALQ